MTLNLKGNYVGSNGKVILFTIFSYNANYVRLWLSIYLIILTKRERKIQGVSKKKPLSSPQEKCLRNSYLSKKFKLLGYVGKKLLGSKNNKNNATPLIKSAFKLTFLNLCCNIIINF